MVSSTVVLAGKTDTTEPVPVTPAATTSGTGTLLAVPSQEQLKKNSMDAASLALIEAGSPDSIAKAVQRINADSRGMTDQNRILLSVAADLMKLLYPAEPVSWPIPSVPDTSPYIGALKSARQGVYDYNTGNADFLSIVLPSLVLVTGAASGDYYDDAEKALLKALSMNPSSVLPPYFLALLATRRGNVAAADAFYEKAWNLDNSCYPAGVGFARSLIRRGNGKAAYSVSVVLLARYPDSLDMVALCAESTFAMKDWTAADPYVLRVLKTQPDNTAFLLMRARILIEGSEYLKANSLLDAFATRNRTDKNYLLLRARVFREWNKNVDSAAALIADAQRLYPDDTDVLLASAEICYQTGRQLNGFAGRDLVQTVLRKDSANRTALALLANDYIAASSWPEAVKAAEDLVRISGDDDARLVLLRACLGAGQTARAVALAREIYGGTRRDDTVTGLYLAALIASGDSRAASDIIKNRMPDAAPSLKSVLHYYESRLSADTETRLSALRSSLLADPRNKQSLFAMYELYLDRKDYRKAQYYLKQVIALDPANPAYLRLQTKLDEMLAR
jgi:uncharacterized protein HemY